MSLNIYGNGTTTASAGANTIVHYYDRAGINAANRVNVYGQWADRRSMPTKMGKTFKISRFEHMYDRSTGDVDFATKGFMTARTADEVSASLTSATLAEGAGAVNQKTLTKVTFSTELARYGEMINYTDEVEMFSEDYIQVKYREELGELANARMEDLQQLDMLSTGTVIYSGDATSMATIGTTSGVDYRVGYDLIRKGVRKLVRNRAKKNTSIVSGSTKIGTTPIAKAFYAIIGADVKADLESAVRGNTTDNGFTEFVYIPAHKYAGAASLAEGEVGAMHEVRFVEAESAVVYAGTGAAVPGGYTGSLAYTTFATDAAAIAVRGVGATAGDYFNVYPILFPTEGAFATVGLKGNEKIKFNAKSPSSVENANPYGTTGFFSYNFFYAGILLREEAMLKMLVAASA